jgi:hypothetical protein
MKKCMRCNIVFHWAKRMRCLYCDALLLTVEKDDTETSLALSAAKNIMATVVKDRNLMGHGRMQYIIGSYFRTRTFQFMYRFSRNELKVGKDYRRFLVQPLNLSWFLVLPWIIINFLDSIIFRVIYNGYCEKCGWKFNKMGSHAEHDPKDCAYKQEYTTIVEDILSGRILKTEERLQEQAAEKVGHGLKSAYRDLCESERISSKFLDILSILVSVLVVIYLLIFWITPRIIKGINGLEEVESGMTLQ